MRLAHLESSCVRLRDRLDRGRRKRGVWMVRAAIAAACIALLCTAAAASADPSTPLGQHGRWVTDADGRVVILHGVNMVYKRKPYEPERSGFGADDAEFLARNGFNTVRLG